MQLKSDTTRTSTFFNFNKVECENKLGKLKVINKELVENNNRKEQLLRQKKSIQDKANEYHATYIVSWEQQAAKDLANIQKLDDTCCVAETPCTLFNQIIGSSLEDHLLFLNILFISFSSFCSFVCGVWCVICSVRCVVCIV